MLVLLKLWEVIILGYGTVLTFAASLPGRFKKQQHFTQERGQPLYVLPDSCPLPLTSNVNSRPVLPLQESQLRKGHGVKFEHTFGDLTRVLKALTLSRIKVKCVGEQGMV